MFSPPLNGSLLDVFINSKLLLRAWCLHSNESKTLLPGTLSGIRRNQAQNRVPRIGETLEMSFRRSRFDVFLLRGLMRLPPSAMSKTQLTVV